MVTAISARGNPNLNKNNHHTIVSEIEGLIKVYDDGRVERSQIVPHVPTNLPQHLSSITCRDVTIFHPANLWARIYVPNNINYSSVKLPILIYFHGGGFCVGSAAWKCYHEFLASFSSQISCVVVSVNYRLAPENRLPAAYDDGAYAVSWVKQQGVIGNFQSREHGWWTDRCDFSRMFVAGDSAGGNIAYHVALRLNSSTSNSNGGAIKGLIMIQPFFGGEVRTNSEKYTAQPPYSALTLHASDSYWSLALPEGTNRDHPWCNPLAANKITGSKLPPTMVCISETDILKDRNLELCSALRSVCWTNNSSDVEKVVYKGVGHAFHILHNSPLSQLRTHEMLSHLKAFVHRH